MAPKLALCILLLTSASTSVFSSISTCPSRTDRATAKTPNIILLLADDVGYGDVEYNPRVYNPAAGGVSFHPDPPQTPNLNAMAASKNSIVFERFYSGSPVCSPTRAASLTGRSPDRDCIFNAEGCGTKPAWTCVDNLPLPANTFTVAEAAKRANYSTIHIGKWHLGDFFPKNIKKRSVAQMKWPTAHPGVHGFDEWYSTEASAPSSTTNCGCNRAWMDMSEGGCIVGGGVFQNASFDCTNYWYPTDLNRSHHTTRPECHVANTSTFDCVANVTRKIEGDDSAFIIDRFEDFLIRKTSTEKSPFLAALWLHSNHVQHVALPEYYYMYNDSKGNPAGDYLGTLTQMDAQIGRLRAMLRDYGVANDTLLMFASDNGPHLDNTEETGDRTQQQATNGLRQCKASVFEGGIRVPGIIEWPSVIKQNAYTTYPAYVSDYLPTVLDILDQKHPQPTWAHDGISLLPLLQSPHNGSRSSPLVFSLGKQKAIIDNDLKLVYAPEKGQCATFEPPYDTTGKGPFLFNLTSDPTESDDLSTSQPRELEAMMQKLNVYEASLQVSQYQECGCLAHQGLSEGAASFRI